MCSPEEETGGEFSIFNSQEEETEDRRQNLEEECRGEPGCSPEVGNADQDVGAGLPSDEGGSKPAQGEGDVNGMMDSGPASPAGRSATLSGLVRNDNEREATSSSDVVDALHEAHVQNDQESTPAGVVDGSGRSHVQNDQESTTSSDGANEDLRSGKEMFTQLPERHFSSQSSEKQG